MLFISITYDPILFALSRLLSATVIDPMYSNGTEHFSIQFMKCRCRILFFFLSFLFDGFVQSWDSLSTIPKKKFSIDHTIILIIIIINWTIRWDNVRVCACVCLCAKYAAKFSVAIELWKTLEWPDSHQHHNSKENYPLYCLLRVVFCINALHCFEHSAFGATQCWWRSECRTWVLRLAYHWKLK